jgi:hypothetical protein
MPTTPYEYTDHSQLHDGMHYPVDHLVGVLRDGKEAEQAVRSLHEAGYVDIVVLNGRPALENIHARERAANPLARAWERLTIYLSDDSDARQAALDALDHGHAIVMVYAPKGAQEGQAEGILRTHGARALTYFGRWSITELSR